MLYHYAGEAGMLTYTTLNGEVLDLTALTEEQQEYLDQVIAAYRRDMPYVAFTALTSGPANPLIREAGRITQAVLAHSLYRAVYDLENRLGIRQGEIAASPDDDLERDPLADEWVPAVEAQRRKGVALSGLHQAIRRGQVIARAAKPGGKRLVVSVNSLARWQPMRSRQMAGRSRAAARRAAPGG